MLSASFPSSRASAQPFGLLKAQGSSQAGSACLWPLLLETFLPVVPNYTSFTPHPAETVSGSWVLLSVSARIPPPDHQLHYAGQSEQGEGHRLTIPGSSPLTLNLM